MAATASFLHPSWSSCIKLSGDGTLEPALRQACQVILMHRTSVRTSVNLHTFHHMVSLDATVHLTIHLGLNPLEMLLVEKNTAPDKQRLKPEDI